MDDLDPRPREHCFDGIGPGRRGRDLKCEADYKAGALAERTRGLTEEEAQILAKAIYGVCYVAGWSDADEDEKELFLDMAHAAHVSLMACRRRNGEDV